MKFNAPSGGSKPGGKSGGGSALTTSAIQGWNQVWNLAAPDRNAFGSEIWDKLYGLVFLGVGGMITSVIGAAAIVKGRPIAWSAVGLRRTRNAISIAKWFWDGLVQELLESYLKSKLPELKAIQVVRAIDDGFDWADNLFKLPQLLEMFR